MALIIGPYGGGTIIGKLGGKVFQRGSYGQVVRNLALPVNPATAEQQQVRVTMALLAFHWTFTLSQTKRDAWTDYAIGTPVTGKLGGLTTLQGRAWFIKNNVMPMLFDNTFNDQPPPTPGIAPPIIPTFVATTILGIQVTAFDTSLPTLSDVEFRVSIPINRSRLYYKAPYVIRFIRQEGSFALPLTLKAPSLVFLNQKYRISYKIIQADARGSQEFDQTVVVT